MGELKEISFNISNPIAFVLPKLIWDEMLSQEDTLTTVIRKRFMILTVDYI